MPEKIIMIPAGDILLESLYAEGSRSEVMVLCHPHSLYGGNMDNNVVVALQKALQDQGWGTLRFNFRGVGRSGGGYADGEGEAEDLMAVKRYLSENMNKGLSLIGYSFGAWIALKAIQKGWSPQRTVLVSPPVDFLPFNGLSLPLGNCLITLGERDSFCAVESLRAWLSGQRSQQGVDIEILPRCDHFYWGFEEALSSITTAFLLKNHTEPSERSCRPGN
jgi:uncharacterized protein